MRPRPQLQRKSLALVLFLGIFLTYGEVFAWLSFQPQAPAATAAPTNTPTQTGTATQTATATFTATPTATATPQALNAAGGVQLPSNTGIAFIGVNSYFLSPFGMDFQLATSETTTAQ